MKKLKYILSILILLLVTFVTISPVQAEEGYTFAVSPMKEKVALNPGDSYSSVVTIYTSNEYNTDIEYSVKTEGFYINENNDTIFEECNNEYCELSEWITIDSPTKGTLSPNQKAQIYYTINVPENAHGGGQYASIIFEAKLANNESDPNASENDNEIISTVTENKRIAYTIYAEVAGDINRQGEVQDINVPSFLLSGNIKGTSSIKNTGNVHGEAKYKLQVFPLFSDEEIYTNEEDPDTKTILPDRTRYEETTWEGTPGIGIFNVLYTVEFEGVTAQVSKMVIKCPIWLLFLIVFIIIALILWLVLRTKNRKNK